MSRLKYYLIIDAHKFACENYNIPRNEFCALAASEFYHDDLLQRTAIEYYDEIQHEMRFAYVS